MALVVYLQSAADGGVTAVLAEQTAGTGASRYWTDHGALTANEEQLLRDNTNVVLPPLEKLLRSRDRLRDQDKRAPYRVRSMGDEHWMGKPRGSMPTPTLGSQMSLLSADEASAPCTGALRRPEQLVPHTSWGFDPARIAPLEIKKLGVSVFGADLKKFDGEGEPDAHQTWYMSARNSVIDLYRLCYPQRISLSDCRRFFDGDLATLSRLYTFLANEKLINFAESMSLHEPMMMPEHKNMVATFQAVERALAKSGTRNNGPKTGAKMNTDDKVDISNFAVCWSCDRICLLSFYTLPGGVTANGQSPVWCFECSKECRSRLLVRNDLLPALPQTIDGIRWTAKSIEKLQDAIELVGLDWIAVAKYVSEHSPEIVPPQKCVSAFLRLFAPVLRPLGVASVLTLSGTNRDKVAVLQKDPLRKASVAQQLIDQAIRQLESLENVESLGSAESLQLLSNANEMSADNRTPVLGTQTREPGEQMQPADVSMTDAAGNAASGVATGMFSSTRYGTTSNSSRSTSQDQADYS